MRGISMAFRDREVRIEFGDLPNGLVALVGENGAGKTTLLECSGPATLFRSFPSYGNESLADHVAPGVRDAFSELTWEQGGSEYRALVQIDPQFGGRGKSEGYLTRDGVPVAGPLVKEYDAAIGGILPPQDLFCASVFAAQGGEGSFFAMPKAARKDLFSAMLGIQHLQDLSEQAKDRGGRVLAALETLRAELTTARARQGRQAELARQLREGEAALARHRDSVQEARAAVQSARAALTIIRDDFARLEAAEAASGADRTRAAQERDALLVEIDRLTAKIDSCQEILAGRTAVEQAVDELRAVESQLPALQGEERALAEQLREIEAALATKGAELQAARAEYKRLDAERQAAAAAGERVAAYDDLVAERDRLTETLAAIDRHITELEAREQPLELAAQTEAEDAAKQRRLRDQLATLVKVSSLDGVDVTLDICSRCPLTAGARSAAAEVEAIRTELAGLHVDATLPAQAARARLIADIRVQQDERKTVAAALNSTKDTMAALEADRAAAARLDDIVQATEANMVRGKGLQHAVSEISDAKTELAAELAVVSERRQGLEERRDTLRPVAAHQAGITIAEAQLAEASTTLAAKCEAKVGTEQRLSDLGAPRDLTPERQSISSAEAGLVDQERLLASAEAGLGELQQQRARIEGEHAALGDAGADVEQLAAREAALARDAADWTLLSRGLGREGVQALEIDAAGPGITTIANDLLASCYGPRFSLAIETTAMKKDGGQKEVFDVRIIDAEAGRDARRGSGGEMVILDEALRLALAIYNAQRSGFELRTLWRDETAGALSAENADRYVQMLRRAMAIGGFYQVLFIAHQEDVYEQADARIYLGGGRVEFEHERVR